jgi:hypothetical protein
MNLRDMMKDTRLRTAFVKAAEDEMDKIARKSNMTAAEKEKRLAYLKGALHDIFLENR